jgi:rSAM/selenodomain-associated transferase 1
MASVRLIVFAKAPILGGVKNRIAAAVGTHRALEIYQSLLGRVFASLECITHVEVRITPDDSSKDFQIHHGQTWNFKPQGRGDLGARLALAFAEAFAAKMERVVIIGSDCPEVREEDIHLAWSALEISDVVLGPAVDGGYWLIGLRKPCPNLFEQIDWSSDKVLQQTLDRAEANDLSVHLLRELSDIDTIEDWQRYLDRKQTG